MFVLSPWPCLTRREESKCGQGWDFPPGHRHLGWRWGSTPFLQGWSKESTGIPPWDGGKQGRGQPPGHLEHLDTKADPNPKVVSLEAGSPPDSAPRERKTPRLCGGELHFQSPIRGTGTVYPQVQESGLGLCGCELALSPRHRVQGDFCLDTHFQSSSVHSWAGVTRAATTSHPNPPSAAVS